VEGGEGILRRCRRSCDRASRRVLAWEQGQGTVEYVALVALVALIMVGVLTAMKSTDFAEGQQIGSLILKKIAEAVNKVHY
jgi:Flp pilus assembly pilin Flp